MNRKVVFSLLAAFMVSGLGQKLSAQGTAFFYQGRLNDAGSPANGVYDLRLALYDASTNGNLIAGPLTNYLVAASSGVFATTVDFGAVFTGTNYWLGLGVRTNTSVPSTNAFTLVWPRQPLLPVPYAEFANASSNLLGALSATQLVGTLPSAQVAGNYSGAVNFSNGTNTFAGAFTGNGLNLTNLNGSMIATGTVADARLSTNVALLNTNQTFTGVNVFSNATNSFTGSFFGNGLVGWIPIPSNSVQAVRDTGYLLLSTNLTTVTLPATASLLAGDIIRISGAGSGGWRVAQNAAQAISGIFYSASNSAWTASATAPSVAWQSIAASADGIKLVASAVSAGGIYTSVDAGQTWNSSSSSYSPNVVASSADGTKLLGAFTPGSIIDYPDSGNAWTPMSVTSHSWTCLASSGDGTRLAACALGSGIYTNSGTTWTISGAPNSQQWNAVVSSSSGQYLAAAIYGGKIYTSTNYGFSWTQQGAPTTNWISLASSADGSKLAAAAYGGRIYSSADYGVTWTQRTNSPTSYWYHLACSSDGGRIVGVVNTNSTTGGSIYVSADYGLTWIKQPLPDKFWYGVSCSADGTQMAAVCHDATSGQIYYWQAAAVTVSSTAGVNGSITGGPGAAVELQYIGPDASGVARFMPISGIGAFWAN